ncbi:RagB/SusD family nutrient uptake outer membrane protein [Chitinophaga caseinilytica]|uniref:RagB/SusD family nutrient uptake outer membrane protein n=1 Tax=Chitinophaga caseinilytica TaxID=2267521 RepID=UPI003C2F905F
MKQSRYVIAAVLLCAIVFGSCKRILELEPKTGPTSLTFWKNDKDALAGLMGGYALIREALTDENRFFVYGDITANTFRVTYSSDYSIHQIANGELDGVYYGYLENLQNWTLYYKAIAQANLLVQKIPTIPDNAFANGANKAYYAGEAHFLRAFLYFYISRVWGDVPLILEPVEDLSQAKNIGREKQSVVLAQCIKDVDAAIQLLPETPIQTNDRGVRASRASALALKAHIYAWMKDFPKCEEATRDLVASPGKYGLKFITDSAEYSRIPIGRSMEAIFEININEEQNEGSGPDIYGSFQGIGSKTLYIPYLATRDASTPDQVPWMTHLTTYNNVYWEDGDLRKMLWFEKDTRTSMEKNIMMKKYVNITYRDGDVRKDPRQSNNLLVFRLSDIILLRAEALSKIKKDTEARDLVNKVRTRARLEALDGTTAGDDLYYFIVTERQRELFAEGHAFWDLLRTGFIDDFNGQFEKAMEPGSEFYGKNYWPIPRALFKDNMLMKQTPYWNGRL